MRLTDLVQAKVYLNKINPADTIDTLTKIQKELDIVGLGLNAEFLDLVVGINNDIDAIKLQINSIADKIKNVENSVADKLNAAAAPYCSKNVIDSIPTVEDLDATGVRTVRHKLFTEEFNFGILSSIRSNTKPQYPGLEIGCGDGYWTKYMVAADPLYIVDHRPEFIETAKAQFPSEYQRRLRTYLLGYEDFERDDLSALPQNQFGYVLSVNHFDFFTLDRLEYYVRQTLGLLRPGGTFLFTYNNCEIPANAKFVELGFKGWATKTDLEKFCKDVGYEILNSFSSIEASWLEIKKPGELKTVKLQQALGEICHFKP